MTGYLLGGKAVPKVSAADAAGLRAVDHTYFLRGGLAAVVTSDGPSQFEWDGTSSAADDGLDVIKPTSVGGGVGRWLAGVHHVRASVAASVVAGISLINPTPSTGGTTRQYSPAVTLTGRSFSGGADHQHAVALQAQPQADGANRLQLSASDDGAAYASVVGFAALGSDAYQEWDSALRTVGWRHAKKSGTGVEVGGDTTVSAQPGRDVAAGANNRGGKLSLRSGPQGAGGTSVAAGDLVLGLGDIEESLRLLDDPSTYPLPVVRLTSARNLAITAPTQAPAATDGYAILLVAGNAGSTGAKHSGGAIRLFGGNADGNSGAGVPGGEIALTAGNGVAGTGTTGDGGRITLTPGLKAGTAADGEIRLQGEDGTNKIRVSKTGFALFNAPPVAQQADSGLLTDSTGGTVDGTLVDVGAVFSQANVNNNFADCADKISKMRTVMRNYGMMP